MNLCRMVDVELQPCREGRRAHATNGFDCPECVVTHEQGVVGQGPDKRGKSMSGAHASEELGRLFPNDGLTV